jgi:hypothetical protein
MMKNKLKALTFAGALTLAHNVSAESHSKGHGHVHGEHCDHSHDASHDSAQPIYLEFDLPGERTLKHPIDPSLLCPKTGKVTVGFILALSPTGCAHRDILDLPQDSTEPDQINKTIQHFRICGSFLTDKKIAEAHRLAFPHSEFVKKQQATAKPDLSP